MSVLIAVSFFLLDHDCVVLIVGQPGEVNFFRVPCVDAGAFPLSHP
jgi:hypothetical protein